MKIVFSGSTSDTGNRVLRKLVEKFGSDALTCLIRPTSDTRYVEQLQVRTVTGDVTQPETLKQILNPSVRYLDMTHPKHYHKSLEAVVNSGIERAYFVTTTGIFSKYNQFSQIYKDNEAKIKASGIVYTILRPSMIYGSMQDKNMHRLIQFLDRYPVFPLFGAGKSLMQPVYGEDLADGIVAAINQSTTEYQEYNLAGPTPISYEEIVNTILFKLQRQVLKINVNTKLAGTVTKWVHRFPGFPITEEQVLRLQEDKTFEIFKSRKDLGFNPRSFYEGIGLEIEEMRSLGVIR
ncbi:SDR family oxidoreductase [Laspinema olomoucense]|uniref:NAD-dependent epimerase/dehydratase family protein n=1 Tax=Laspinema olomoucense D3b TaxID=2953688 RepID=A0ABT2N6C8_9CYAN|nr:MULTISPECIES: NAD-dependent epimerase/dehydratase family protein [unclassified Laspinema]MCT7977399.1 NAD-dependent epimerase/dehydratase family protein [Laspinema sp. D3b]MCT7986818.1 NAD-dependent epimerase/dehydratase family protein [Laspinema sp. D3a]